MQIINSSENDINTIFEFYDHAIAYQKTKFNKHWQGFDLPVIEKEIRENRQFKIVVGEKVVCIFAITFNDPAIWGEKDKDKAVYIHRIVTHPDFHGNNYVKQIVKWAIAYCEKNSIDYVRMDTWGDNQKLIEHYQGCGFTFMSISDKMSDANLPKHYDCISLSLFEIDVKKTRQYGNV
jgi:ribosomal protein S18 acetylase RimI-like enzyme